MLIAWAFKILILVQLTRAYLQFEMIRTPHRTKANPHSVGSNLKCPNSKSQANKQKDKSITSYSEICYDKDISYAIQLYDQNGDLYHLSVDLTTPISWFKGNYCTLQALSKQQSKSLPNQNQKQQKSDKLEKCRRIQVHFKQKVQYIERAVMQKLYNKIHKHKDKQNTQNSANHPIATVKINGSSQTVKGFVQKVDTLDFWTRDSGRLTKIVDILLLGFYMLDEKDKISLKHTNFINATSITPNMNYLSDGAISLRFDQNSEKSFLQEIFNYVFGTSPQNLKSQQIPQMQARLVTLYLGEDLGKNNSLTIGEMSLKHVEGGYSSISWVSTIVDEYYGSLPKLNQMVISYSQNEQIRTAQVEIGQQMYAVFTLSASYISLPNIIIQKLLQKFGKSVNCSVSQATFELICETKKKDQQFLQRQIIFDFGTVKCSFKVDELISKIQKDKKKVVYTLFVRQGFDQNYAIFGQPLFKKYTILLDFTKNRVGIGRRREHYGQQYLNVVSLIRFVTFVFVIGCAMILCFAPLSRMITVFKENSRYGYHSVDRNSHERRRLRKYGPIQQNPYAQLKGKIQQVLNDHSEATEIEAI